MSNKAIYTNCYEIVSTTDYFLYIFIGGRGIGKSYSMLSEAYKHQDMIMYVRRTDTELKNCCDEFTNPYKSINQNIGSNISIKPNKDNALIIEKVDEDHSNLIGYASALSTFGKFRGADFSDVNLIIFDEFINTSPVNSLKGEAGLLFNLIETINRNRELEDKEAVKVVLLSNSNTIDDDIIRVLNLGDQIQQMKTNNEHLYKDNERGIYLSLLENKTVKDMKLKTKLYKLTKGTSFYDMAIENEFTKDYFGDLKKINYQELQPVVNYESVYFYKHKSKDIMLASHRKANCEKYNERTKQAFKRNYGYMFAYYIETGLMFYTDYNVKLEVKNIF